MRRRICVISEGLRGSRDEGMRNFVSSLAEALARSNDVRTIAVDTGVGTPGEVRTNRLLASRRLRRILIRHRPDVILYVPLASSTLGSFVRSRVLALLLPRVPVVMIALQPRRPSGWKQALLRWLAPAGFLAQAPSWVPPLPPRVHIGTIPSGVDLARFRPPILEERESLRRSMHVRPDEFVVLHVGHIRRERDVAILADLARRPGFRVVLVGSTSTEQDEDTASDLQASGVHVIRERVERIEDIYRAADAYVFPVRSDQAAIEMPLSVLEAMATNLPVVTTRFGALPRHFPEGRGLRYFTEAAEVPALLEEARRGVDVATRERVLPFRWERVAEGLVDTLDGWGLLGGRR